MSFGFRLNLGIFRFDLVYMVFCIDEYIGGGKKIRTFMEISLKFSMAQILSFV